MSLMNSPLAPWHQQAQAEMQPHPDGEIVSTYGRLPLEYAAMFRAVGLMDCSYRCALEVTGEDRLSFLNSLLTCELIEKASGKPLSPGQWRFAFLLDRKGRILSEMNVLVLPDRCLLEMEARFVESTAKELEKYHFREKVAIRSLQAVVAEVALFGPAGAKLLEIAGGPKAGELPEGACREFTTAGAQAVVWREDLGDCQAHRVLLPAGKLEEVWKSLLEGPQVKVTPIGWAAYNAARIEAGRPLLGVDYDGSFLPAETGQLRRAVSFTKGCYPGQEIVARMESHEQRSRQVVKLELAGDTLPMAGEKVFDPSGNEVGALTSSTLSPRLSNHALCLAIVKKGFFTPGTTLQVPAEGQMRTATVCP